MNYDHQVWVPDPKEGFKLIEKTNVAASNVKYPVGDPNKNEDDNCALMFLNEATLLNNLRIRYAQDKIYTYVANILIAVNPYYPIQELYSEDTIKKYPGKSLGEEPPHIFAIAEKSFQDMKMNKSSQSIIVSGESGAGKTESTKYLLQYLCKLKGSSDNSLEQKILAANPILEAFGNAKTQRNKNSSRFGKFMEVHFAKNFQIVGGSVSHYLLEKSRICLQNSDERNYHIFYMLCAGAPLKLHKKLGISKPDDFLYLKNGCNQYFCNKESEKKLSQSQKSQSHLAKGCLSDSDLDDVEGFNKVDQAFTRLGLTEVERIEIYSTVAAVLHLGNICFETIPNDPSEGCRITAETINLVEKSANLLRVDSNELKEALVSHKRQSIQKVEVIESLLRPDQAENARNALAKAVYSELFNYIVSRVNKSIPSESHEYYIGVLDIAGFESFEVNSFEQFCINYCNEKLQQFFNQRVLKSEQDTYKAEKLNVPKITYVDNKECITMIEDSEKGIFSLLENFLRRSDSTPEEFTNLVHQTWDRKDKLKQLSTKCRALYALKQDEGFLINHFAGEVCYQTSQFIEKNNDALNSSLQELMQKSGHEFLQTGFATDPASRIKKRVIHSVGSKFKKQLRDLMDELKKNETNFVRCIKPNNKMEPRKFDGSCVLSQLKYSGMTSVFELMGHGYPSRVYYEELYKVYEKFLSTPDLAGLKEKDFCEALVQSLELKETEDFKLGEKRVFFKPGKFAEFDKIMKSDEKKMKQLVINMRKWLRKSRITKLQNLKEQVLKMKEIANQLESTGNKRIESIENFELKINVTLEKIEANQNIQPVKIDNKYTELKDAIDKLMTKLEGELEQQKKKKEEQRLAEIKAEEERRRQEELAGNRLEEARKATHIPDPSKWKYSQLYAGFYSNDPNKKAASLIEIRKRLDIYHNWKAENNIE